jgi:site-specific recombinase XerD
MPGRKHGYYLVTSFYGFLFLEGVISFDPTELIDSPSLGRHLPEVLTVAEIDAIWPALICPSKKASATRLCWKPCIVVACVYRSSSA